MIIFRLINLFATLLEKYLKKGEASESSIKLPKKTSNFVKKRSIKNNQLAATLF